ncbi:MAG: TonB-dependent receptor [Wenzhouxiangella sp.]
MRSVAPLTKKKTDHRVHPQLALKLLPAAMLLALGHASAASESEPDAEGEIIDRVSVTAERGRERIAQEIPQAITTITREQLDETVYIDLTEAIRRQPSIGLGPAGEALNFWQQGFTIRGLGSQRVLTLTDGVRLSGQGTGYGGGNISLYDTFSVDRIEILRGPNSVLHGTDALGGVINVITRQPRRRDEVGMNGGIGYHHDSAFSLNRFSAFVDAGNPQGVVVAGASQSSNKNPTRPDGTQATSGAADHLSGFFRAEWRPDASRSLQLFGNLSRDTDVEVEDTAIPFGPVGSGPLRFSFPLYQRSLLGLRWQQLAINPRVVDFNVSANWQQIRREFDRTAPEAFFAPPPPRIESVRIVTDDQVDTFEISPQLRLDFAPQLITLGLDLGLDRSVGPETETRAQLFPFGPPSPLLRPGPTERLRVDAEQQRLGAYAQSNWTVSSQLEVISGLRLDYFSVDDDISGLSRSQTGWSGNLAAVYQRNSEHSFYGNLGRGFRAPDLAERFQRAVVAVVETVEQRGNPDLDPETALSLELGSKWQNRQFSGEAAVFFNRIDDFIGLETLSVRPRVEQTANFDSVDLYGWELALAWRTGNVELFSNASRTYAPSDREIIRVVSGRLNYGLAWRFAGPWDSNGRIEALGRTVLASRDATELEPIDYPSFTVFELRARIDIPTGPDQRLRLLAGVRNLTDKTFREPFFNQIQPERSFYGAAQWFF